jgi:hypothetical protein
MVLTINKDWYVELYDLRRGVDLLAKAHCPHNFDAIRELCKKHHFPTPLGAYTWEANE